MARTRQVRPIALSDEEVEGLLGLGKLLLKDGELLNCNLTGVIRWVALNGERRLIGQEDKESRMEAVERRLRKIEEKMRE